MRRPILGLGLVSLLTLASVSVAQAQFDPLTLQFEASKRVTKQGVIVKMDQQNPYVWVHFEVRDRNTGKVENWSAEISQLRHFYPSDWRPSIGHEIVVSGSLAKDGSNRIRVGANGLKWAITGLLAK